MQGWIKLHRKIVDWEWYDHIPTFKLFIHMLIKANHESVKWRGQEIPKGAFITSIASLSAETGLTVKQVRTGLKNLEKTGEIDKQTGNQNTLIIVLNYERYQEFDCEYRASESANKGQSEGKQRATNKNDNNKKNDKEEKNKYIVIIAYLNNKAGTKYKWQSSYAQKYINARLKDGFSINDFKKVIDNKCNEWLNSNMRKYLRPSTLFGTKFESYLNQKTESENKYVRY